MSQDRPRPPHPIPYQGSKRAQAARILAHIGRLPARPARLIEPFAGSAAVTLAAAQQGIADRYLLGDSLAPLAALWARIIADPIPLAERYAALWRDGSDPDHYRAVRDAFNRDPDPAKLLYLLARCVKGAVRFNRRGEFNQAADRRRRGMTPERARAELLGAHRLLTGRADVTAGDYAALLAQATPADVVYLDPPYEGTSGARDQRYARILDRDRLIADLAALQARDIPTLLSFDGSRGAQTYGTPLPDALGLRREAITLGRSAQSTLLGRTDITVESLYLSPHFPP